MPNKLITDMLNKKPILLSKVIKTIKMLSIEKGFTLQRIAAEIGRKSNHRSARRTFAQIRLLVKNALKYGVKNKYLCTKRGKYHVPDMKLKFVKILSQTAKPKKKKKVRFAQKTSKQEKKGKKKNLKSSKIYRSKTKKNISKDEINVKRKNRIEGRCKCIACNTEMKNKSRSRSGTRSSRNQVQSHSNKSKQSQKTKLCLKHGYCRRSPEYQEYSSEMTPEDDTSLIVEPSRSREPLNVSSERDTHDVCVNKKRGRPKDLNNVRPPRLESDSEEKNRPTYKYIEKIGEKYPNNIQQKFKRKYKWSHGLKRDQQLRQLIPDDKMYQNFKSCSKHCKNHQLYALCVHNKRRRLRYSHNNNNRCETYGCLYHLKNYLLDQKKSIAGSKNSSDSNVVTTRRCSTPFRDLNELNYKKNNTSVKYTGERLTLLSDIEEEI